MKLKYMIVLLIGGGTVLIASWIAGQVERGKEAATPKSIWSVPIQDQAVYERTLRPTGSREAFSRFQDTLSFDMPNALFMQNGDVFVFDYGPMQAHRFSGSGKLKATYGTGRGREPGELLSLTDASISQDETYVIIADAIARTLSIYLEDGTYVRRLTFADQYFRVLERGGELLVQTLGEDLFRKYDQTGRLIRAHGSLVQDRSGHALSTSGRLLESADEGFIFIPIDGGYIFYFDDAGATRQIVRTIDGWEFPFRGDNAEARARLTTGAEHSLATQSYVDREAERIYIEVVHVNRENNWVAGFLDAYHWRTGAYIESWRLPFATHGAGMLETGIVAVRGRSIVVIPVE